MKDLSTHYPIWFCDIWGVVHNGYTPFAETLNALVQHRANGGTVILVTNSPRTSAGVASQISEIGVGPHCYDAIVTSGDVTRDLMVAKGGGKIFHLGPDRDHSIFAGLAVARVALNAARAVVCTGFFHEESETPESYVDLLAEMKTRELLMICANPDKIVRKGDQIFFCAGAIADAYEAIGGGVAMAGKPFTPIYDLAMKTAANCRGHAIDKSQVLAIGDGPDTDIKGAAAFGLPVLLVADGVTDASLGLAHAQETVQKLVPSARIVATVANLRWA